MSHGIGVAHDPSVAVSRRHLPALRAGRNMICSSFLRAAERRHCHHASRSTLPGFMMFLGSSERLMVRIVSSSILLR